MSQPADYWLDEIVVVVVVAKAKKLFSFLSFLLPLIHFFAS